MKKITNKKYITVTLCLLLSFLILIGTITILVDPLYQYHKPWFGLQPVLKKERYHNSGMARNFDYENVIMGNSLSENFNASWFDEAFSGKTIKLVASASHTIDDTYLLNVLQRKDRHPKVIIHNLDQTFFTSNPFSLKHELPEYLYDNNYLNDVSYIFNFQIFYEYTCNCIVKNLTNEISDLDTAFSWDDGTVCGKENVLASYERAEPTNEPPCFEEEIETAVQNFRNIEPYIQAMDNTEYIFFCSPFSMVYWDSISRSNRLEVMKEIYTTTIAHMLEYDNVTVFLWTDPEMLNIMANLNNYRDMTHFGINVSEEIANRICNGYGILDKDNYIIEIDKFFDFLTDYPYDSIFD